MTLPLPEAFLAEMKASLTDADAFFTAMEAPCTRGLRLNPRKPLIQPDKALEGLMESVPWWNGGFYLSLESTAGADPLHEAGAYYLQEPSAMAPARVLDVKPGERVLDLCAAPGGKSTQMADALAGKGLLVSNEPVPSRARVLSGNIERMGIANALVVSAEPERLALSWPESFDAILVDAPCSGEGMFRRHPELRAEWHAGAPAGCAARQLHILRCAVRLLKPGGRLAYSTCTFNRTENEDVIVQLMDEEPSLAPEAFSLPIGEGRTLEARDGAAHLYPHRLRGEGHFIALMRKASGETNGVDFLTPERRLGTPGKELSAAYREFAKAFSGQADALPAPDARFEDALLCAPPLPPLEGIRVLRAGLRLGVLKGKAFAPDHALAMALRPIEAFPCVTLDRTRAKAYLRGEALDVPEEAPSGYALAAYQGLTLGFGKISDGLLKNHYPKGLRKSLF